MTSPSKSSDNREIERKFLVHTIPDNLVRYPNNRIVQGYLAVADDGTEVRLRRRAEEFYLTQKSGGTLSREEWQTELSQRQFEALWPATNGRRVEKVRYEINHGDFKIELDVYGDKLVGLATAEVEFASENECERFTPPAWIGREVTDDSRYKNKNLALHGLPERLQVSEGGDIRAELPFGQWVEGVVPDDSLRDAAKCSLQVRLLAVQHYLPLAANRVDEDIGYVHQLRVFTRRSLAAIEVFDELLPKSNAKWLNKKLRQIRHAAGKARDLDVLEQRHVQKQNNRHARKFLSSVRKRRAKAQLPIIEIWKRLQRDDSFARHLADLWDAMEQSVAELNEVRFGDWARVRMQKTLKRFFKASTINAGDLDALHRFRIRGKELRYTMELLAAAFPASFRDELYPVVEQLQELLGDINDHAIACVQFRKWVKAAKKKDVAYQRKLLVKERIKLDKSVHRFTAWWTPSRASSLAESFQHIGYQPDSRKNVR